MLACSAGKEARYLLEQPPTLITTVTVIGDTSSIPARTWRKGLGKQVTWLSTTPPAIRLKQTMAMAWHTVAQALRQSHLKISDREQDKGRYSVVYKTASGFSDWLMSRDKTDVLTYSIMLSPDGADTQIRAELATDIEQNLQPDDSKALLQSLYNTLHNDLLAE